MIELKDDELVFRFPEVHESAKLRVGFQRTLRIPDDNRAYPLPPGFGTFPLNHVDDYADRVPEAWRRHGGVFLPMHQAEAMWINFRTSYPMAVKVAAGKIDALTGKQCYEFSVDRSGAATSKSVQTAQPRLRALRGDGRYPCVNRQMSVHRFICPHYDKVQMPYANGASEPYHQPGIPIRFTSSRAAL